MRIRKKSHRGNSDIQKKSHRENSDIQKLALVLAQREFGYSEDDDDDDDFFFIGDDDGNILWSPLWA